VTAECLKGFPSLKEAAFLGKYSAESPEKFQALLDESGVTVYRHTSEGFWGQSVAEFALGLTICALRRIPQTHHEIIASHDPWHRGAPDGKGGRLTFFTQFSDDHRFTNGTVEGKRVRIVGVGNIGSRYASFMKMLGADVAAWDPMVSEPAFHRAGARRVWHLDELGRDAEIFAPMVPLVEATRGLVTREHIEALPQGCLVVVVTRAKVCDTEALRERVLAGELALAADVFDVEPLPLNDPLLDRPNVVHTPHIAGRTRHANEQWAEALAAQFRPR
jgi:phosphoglycerate dehydrogenase-like enzyme